MPFTAQSYKVTEEYYFFIANFFITREKNVKYRLVYNTFEIWGYKNRVKAGSFYFLLKLKCILRLVIWTSS